jgi:predicted RNA polymerase sigma factor
MLQAAIAACHARSRSVDTTDWQRVAALYTVLAHLAPSPVVAPNRAVAVGRADGPARGLALAEQLDDQPALARYPHLPAARATFLQQLGRLEEAEQQYRLAAGRTSNARERQLYLRQAETVISPDRSPSP